MEKKRSLGNFLSMRLFLVRLTMARHKPPPAYLGVKIALLNINLHKKISGMLEDTAVHTEQCDFMSDKQNIFKTTKWCILRSKIGKPLL